MNDAKSSLPGENPGPEDAPASRGRTDTAFPVVGIGASAGGLEAVSQLLEALPPNTGMAFVLVQHLDPKHESKLDSILAKATAMPVRDATNGTAVETDRLYIIPPNATMAIADGVLHLEPRGEGGLHHLPVDAFFKSLAEDRHSGAIGVVLSGTGSDGTLGLEDLKAAGGITFAQSEESAKYAGMPEVGLLSASFVALVDALSALLGFAALAFELDGALDVDLPADADALLVVPDVALVESGFASSCPATPPIAPPATAPTGPPTTAPPTAPDAAPTVVACSFLVMSTLKCSLKSSIAR